MSVASSSKKVNNNRRDTYIQQFSTIQSNSQLQHNNAQSPSNQNTYKSFANKRDSKMYPAEQDERNNMVEASFFGSHEQKAIKRGGGIFPQQEQSQFKLPQIKARDGSSPVEKQQRMSQQIMEQVENVDKKHRESSVGLTQKPSYTVHNSSTTNDIPLMHPVGANIVTDFEKLSMKKAANFTRKGPPHLTEELILKKAKQALTINSQQYMILLNGGPNAGLTVSGCKHDILLQEGKKKQLQQQEKNATARHMKSHSMTHQESKEMSQTDTPFSTHQILAGGPAPASPINRESNNFQPKVKQKFNYQYSNIKNQRTNKIEAVDPYILPDQQTEVKKQYNNPAATRVPQYTSKQLQENYGTLQKNSSQKKINSSPQKTSNISLRESITHDKPSTYDIIEGKASISQFLANVSSVVAISKEWTPSRLPNYSNYQQCNLGSPYLGGTDLSGQRGGAGGQGSEFLSPKLLYKKKKREFYQSQQKNQIINSPMFSGANLNTQANKPEPSRGIQTTNLNNYINQLLQKNGDKNLSLVSALKSASATPDVQHPGVNDNIMIEGLTRSIGDRQGFQALQKSISQDVMDERQPTN